MAIVFAVREGSDDEGQLVGLPEMSLDGLPDGDARALLETVVPGRLDEGIRDRIIAETRGNPLALLELPRGMSAAELAGGFGLPSAGDLGDHIEERYAARLGSLPESTQRLMLLAAADPVGDATLLWRAAQTLGIEREAAAAAANEHLLDIAARVRFRHPLVRSAVYQSASAAERRAAHQRARGGDRSGGRSGSPRVASRPSGNRCRRVSRDRAGAVGGSGSGAWRAGGSGCIPRALREPDRRSR